MQLIQKNAVYLQAVAIMNHTTKDMKKAVILFVTLVVLTIVATSCMSSQGCAAYGERSRYQIERR